MYSLCLCKTRGKRGGISNTRTTGFFWGCCNSFLNKNRYPQASNSFNPSLDAEWLAQHEKISIIIIDYVFFLYLHRKCKAKNRVLSISEILKKSCIFIMSCSKWKFDQDRNIWWALMLKLLTQGHKWASNSIFWWEKLLWMPKQGTLCHELQIWRFSAFW